MINKPDDEDLKIYKTKKENSRAADSKGGGKPIKRPLPEGEKAGLRNAPTQKIQYEQALRLMAERRRQRSLKLLMYVVAVILSSIILAAFIWICADDVLALTKPYELGVVEIGVNDDLSDITKKLKDAELVRFGALFKLYARFTGAMDKIDAGTYELNSMYDYRALVANMRGVSEARMTVTLAIPEGYEQARILRLLADNGVAELRELEQTAANYDFDYSFLKKLPLGDKNRLEGYLFPDTYDFYIDEDPVNVINKFLANFSRKFDETLIERIDTLNEELAAKMVGIFTDEEIQERMMDTHKIVIIASLIEKEAAGNVERTTIASVIHNRLTSKLYPALQIDATIQYVLEERKEVLSYSDLAIDSPYNTYNRPGLPAGPIANPGIASIRAALYPETTAYYFYALDVDGTHHFSETSIDHQRFLDGLKGS